MKEFSLFCVSCFIFIQSVKSQTSYTWNGATSTAWNVATNWTPNGIPGGNAGDNVTIVTKPNICILNANTVIANITMTSGTLDLGGFTLSPTGNGIFTAGTIQNGVLTISGVAANTAVLTNTTFNANATLNITTGAITVSGGTYGGAVMLNQTGATQTTGTGGATFNSTLSITNSGSSNFRINGNCTYNGAVTFANSGSGYLLPELTTGSTYNNTLTLNNTSATQNIRVAYLGTNKFNGNIVINNTGGGSITFCEQATATATLANGQTISIGGSGFTVGTLTLSRFTQTGATAQNLTLTGSAAMTFNNSTTFNGVLMVSSPNIYTSNCTYNGITSFTKTDGTSANGSTGGNTFGNTLTINYTAANAVGAWFGFATNTADIYNGDVYVNNSSTDRFLWGVGGSPISQFNGNLIVTQTGSAIGISTAWSAGSGCIMAAGKTISIGAAGFSTGYLYLQGLTQNGNAAMNLTLTGSSSINVGEGASYTPTSIGGSFTVSAPDVYIRGGTFAGAVTITKTGGTSNHNNQRLNTFNSTCTINQQSNTGYFMLGYNSADAFNDNITVSCTGTGGIYLGWTAGTGIPTLAAGKTILVGGAGFSAGFLSLNTFTQLGNAAMNLAFTGANTSLTFARSSVIGGNLITNTPDVYFNGCTFNGTVDVTKTGAGSDAGSGGNTFQLTSNFTNTGTGYLMFGNGTADVWNGDVSFTNSGSERILPCWNSAGNQFNGNITVSNTGSATGIEFCGGNAASSCTLAAAKNIQIGAGGYNTGYLHLYRFTQLGNAASNLTFTGAATVIVIGPTSAISGDFTVVSPRILLNGATYSGNVNLTKNGATGEWSNGGNTFNGATTTINQLGSGFFGFANGSPDIYNGDVYVNNNSTERVIFGNSSAGNQFNGNVILTQIGSSLGIAFGWNATTSITMAAGKTISIGGAGYSVGYLQIERFTQLGSSAMNLPLTGTSSLTFGPTSVIGGNVVSTSASLFFNGCAFNGTLDATKNGATSDASSGGNIFQGASSFTNSGSGYLLFGNGTADTWNAASNFNNSGSNIMYIAYNSAGNMFNGNISVSSTGSATGIQFCAAAAATATLSAGNAILTGAGGYTSGYLILQRFTQLGNAATNLTLTATASYLQFGPSSTLGGNVTSSSPGLYFNGCTFTGTVNSTKTGATNDNSIGNNIFNGVTTITTNSGQLLFGNGNADQFNAASTFNNYGTASFYVAYNSANNIFGGDVTFNNSPTANTLIYVSPYSAGTIFNGNIIVTSTFGQGVQFCSGNATAMATLSANETITIGAAGFSAGTLLLKQFTQIGPTAQSLILTGTGILTVGPSSAFGGNVNFLATQLNLNGCTYSGLAILEQNGATNSNGTGGNIFNGTTVITNSGSAQFLTGNTNADQFNASTTFNNTGSYRFVIANNHGGQITTFASDVTFNSNKSVGGDAWSFFACEGTNTNISFGGNVTINNLGAIQSNCRFMNGNGSTGSYTGLLTINVTNTNAATVMQMGVNGTSTYNGSISVTNSGGSSGIYFNVNTVSSSTLANGQTITTGAGGFNAGGLYLYRFTQIGGTTQSLTLTGIANLTFGPTAAFGGNVTCSSPTLYFNGCTYSGIVNATKTGVTNDGSIGNNVFNGVTTITNAGSGYLQFGNGNADQFNSTSTFNNTGSSTIYVADNSANNTFGGDATFNNTPTANTLIYVSRLSTGTIFNGNIIVTSTFGQGVQFCQGNATASATLSAAKTISIGAGSFSSGTLLLKQFTQVGATLQSLTLTGTGNITFGPTSAFGGNVTTVSPTLLFNGCNFSGTVTSTKNGATNDASIGNNTFGGAFTITNTGIGYFLMGNGSPDVWNSSATFNNLSTGQHMYTAYNSTGNIFNGDVVFNNQPTSNGLWIYPNQFGINTQFNGNISVINVNGGGVYFGLSTGTSTLAVGKTISVGVGGFNFGALIFANFTQTGATAQSITTIGTSTIQYATGTTFNGNLTSVSPSLLFNGTTFNGTLNCTKNGASNDQSTGANTFNGSSTFTNSGTGYLRLAGTTADAYNSDVTFVQSNTGAVSPSYNTNCTYAGNITVTSPAATAITFGSGASGISTMNGSAATAQTINLTTGKTPVFTQFVMNNSGTGGVTLNTPINVSTSLTMTSGLLNTTAVNVLTMLNGSTASSITSASPSYVNGPMKYQLQSVAATTLNFPIGTSPDCRPVALTVKHTTAATLYNYTAQLYNANPWVAMGSGTPYIATNMPSTVDTISQVHYWTINRTDNTGTSQPNANLSGNQTIQLFFGINDFVYQGSNLTIVKNTSATPAAWIDIGGTSALGNFSSPQAGSVTSTSSPTAFNSFSSFTLGSRNTGWNPLPIELLDFNAVPEGENVNVSWETKTEVNNKYFTIERSKDGINFYEFATVNSKEIHGNSNSQLNYEIMDTKPFGGVSYYRLKQTDYNNNYKCFNVVSVDFDKKSFVSVFPNPASNTLFVNVSDDYDNASLRFIDALGREVLEQTIHSAIKNSISAAYLEPGIYIVIITNGNGGLNKTTLIIQK